MQKPDCSTEAICASRSNNNSAMSKEAKSSRWRTRSLPVCQYGTRHLLSCTSWCWLKCSGNKWERRGEHGEQSPSEWEEEEHEEEWIYYVIAWPIFFSPMHHEWKCIRCLLRSGRKSWMRRHRGSKIKWERGRRSTHFFVGVLDDALFREMTKMMMVWNASRRGRG